MNIRILGWKEHRAKHNLVNPWWFKWHNAHALSVKFLPLKMREFMALVYVLSLASESNSASVSVSWEHLQVFGRMGKDDFADAIKILEEFGLLEVSWPESGRNPAEIRQIPGQNIPSREEKRREEKRREEQTAETFSALTYEPLEENQPRKKRERKPKPELNCEVLPELIGLKEILEGRRVSQLLQAKWLKNYHPSVIDRGIRKADAWATAKGKTQANWGLFFNNWLSRDSQPRLMGFNIPNHGGQAAAQEAAPRKKTWFELDEERKAREAKGEANETQ